MTIQNLLTFLLFLAANAQEQETCTVTIDAATGACEDTEELCPFWAKNDECETNPEFMLRVCAKSCNSCSAPGGIDEPATHESSNATLATQDEEGEEDYGVAQAMDYKRSSELVQTLSDMKLYFKNLRKDPDTTPRMHELLDNCKNKHEHCAFWKVLGECDKVR